MQAIFEQVKQHFVPKAKPLNRMEVEGVKIALYNGVTRNSLDEMLVQFDGSEVDVDFTVYEGEESITNLAPENCHEGSAASIEIQSVTTAEPFLFCSDDCTLSIRTGSEIGHLLTQKQIDALEESILRKLVAA